MIFYTYTLKKILNSASTYITGVAALLPMWIAFVKSAAGGFNVINFAIIQFFVFPLFAIFVAFKTSQIFRDEIENKTILVLQSKPISKKEMVFQGMLVLFTLVVAMAMISTFTPMFLGYMIEGEYAHWYAPFITTMTVIILGSIIASLSLWLSLKLKGKAFVGLMIGIFGAGFYMLFGLSSWLKSTHELDSMKYSFNGATNGEWQTVRDENEFSAPVDEVYKDLESEQNIHTYDIIKWFDPATHWMRMFGGASSSSDGKRNMLRGFVEGYQTTFELKVVHFKTPKQKVVTEFQFRVKYKDSIPAWYAYLVWIIIGGVSIPLTVRSLIKKNIS